MAEHRTAPNAGAFSPPATEGMSDFESRLSSYTRVPAERLPDLLSWSEERVLEESRAVGEVLKRFADAVATSMEDPASADDFLRDLDLEMISRDHDWRAVFSGIRRRSAGAAGHRRTVLVKYLQYLSFRKRLLEFIFARRQGLHETGEFSDAAAIRRAREGVDTERLQRDFVRLEAGETLEIGLGAGRDRVELMLAAHLYRLVVGDPPSIIDQNGVTYFLKSGRNMVGRHPEGDVVVDQNFNDVSRAHLVIDWSPEGWVRLTDLSTRGTFVHRHAVARAGHPLPLT